MGVLRRAWDWLNASPSVSFSESGYRPVDQLLLARLDRTTGVSVGRAEALSVPAVLRGRNLICSVATLPLVQRGPDRSVVANPLFQDFDPDVGNVVHLAQTIEDLVFDGIAWWQVTAFGWDGFPTSVRRLDPATVSLQPPGSRSLAPLPAGHDPRDAVVYVDGRPVFASEIIRFDSPNPAVLKVAGDPIHRAILLNEAAATYADDPQPAAYFTPGEGADPADDDDVRDMLVDWKRARKERSTAYVPMSLKYNAVSAPSPRDLQLVELQKQAGLEIANAFGVDPEDLGISTTSRTYANNVDRRRDRINDVLAPYMRAITDRLSKGDITKRGYTVEFRLDDYLKSNPTERWATYTAALKLGAITVEEIREAEGWPALPASATEPEPAVEPEQVDASAPPALTLESQPSMTFDGQASLTFTFDNDPTEFAVDIDKRTISGTALPYNKWAKKNGLEFRFDRGSLEYGDLTRVKLFRDHDYTQGLGHALHLDDRASGVLSRMKVARGPEGDAALVLADDKVLDGLSVGVDFDISADTVPDPKRKGALLVRRATLREISLTAMPAFDDARVTKVAASRTQGDPVSESTIEPTPAPAAPAVVPAAVTLSAEQFSELMGRQPAAQPEPEVRQVVNPTRLTASVSEPLPYRFSRKGGRHVFEAGSNGYDFSTDLFSSINTNGADREALGRVNALISAAFDVDRADTADLNPNVYRPDMWQPQTDYATPLWDMIASGTTDGRSFDVPKYNSSSGLVGAATEGTEPAAGAMTVTDQTVTPTQVWGKVEITRQAARRGGNPQLSGIIWDQMLREYYDDREAAVATFLNTLTAATDIALTGRPASSPDNDDDRVTASDLEAAIADLQFVRGGNRFRAFAVHQDLYRLLARVKDSSGRPLYPQINPQNANGTAENLFSTLNIAGTRAVGAYALGAGGQTTATNSWLFDPAKVRGWASAPERLDWNFGATVQTANIPQLSHVTIGIYGDIALANLDINGVRQVTFDPSV
ncbi:phage portal protein [Micromonospora noduli]|uniref:phage portal protein n=1 Tax=Micromonospora noduli TaxID=709876 RepID=UPI00124AEB73|nr:phage portal protein [Micromonospora noduli]KAB1925145.1 phage portal protein [Micromonospora noduli]